MTYRIVIPNWRPVPDNKLTRGNRYKANRWKQADAQMVACYARLAEVPAATGKRRVRLEIVLSGRQQEADPNAYSKSLCDALVKCKMIVDDSSEWMEWEKPMYTRGTEPVTVIVLENVNQ